MTITNILPQGIQGPPGPPGTPALVTPVDSGPYTASAISGLSIFTIYNTSGSGFVFNLPGAPAANQIIIISDAELTAAAHEITIQGNGNNICAYGVAATANIGINSNGGAVSLAWDGLQWTQFA
jgi:hypothetical protein